MSFEDTNKNKVQQRIEAALQNFDLAKAYTLAELETIFGCTSASGLAGELRQAGISMMQMGGNIYLGETKERTERNKGTATAKKTIEFNNSVNFVADLHKQFKDGWFEPEDIRHETKMAAGISSIGGCSDFLQFLVEEGVLRTKLVEVGSERKKITKYQVDKNFVLPDQLRPLFTD